MTIRTFFTPGNGHQPGPGYLVQLPQKDLHHLTVVLRLRDGASIVATDSVSGARFESLLRLPTSGPGGALELVKKIVDERPRSRVLCLAPALMKGDRNDLVCEKACELGVQQIFFWQAERSVVRLDSAADIEKKRARFEKIAQGAARQSDRSSIPDVQIANSLASLLELLAPRHPLLVASLQPDATSAQNLTVDPQSLVQLIIGPEGDFAPPEEALLKEKKAHLLSLGPLVLRSETASIVAVATINAVLGYR